MLTERSCVWIGFSLFFFWPDLIGGLVASTFTSVVFLRFYLLINQVDNEISLKDGQTR